MLNCQLYCLLLHHLWQDFLDEQHTVVFQITALFKNFDEDQNAIHHPGFYHVQNRKVIEY